MAITWAGATFEGPLPLEAFPVANQAGIFAVVARMAGESGVVTYRPLYFGLSDECTIRGFPWAHPAAACWLDCVDGHRGHLFGAIHFMTFAGTTTREAVLEALVREYSPACA